ncbi:MAG: hypothetical protein IJ633_02610, partial [Prevotella sp.]|nr:hypothetical protein [Prevotella sp.]
TLYGVVNKRYKPASALSKAMGGVTESIGGAVDGVRQNAKKIGIGIGAIALVGGAVMMGPSVIKMFQKTDADWTRDLNKAIEKKDYESLLEFAEKDSARAILPLSALYLEKGDTVNARKYAEKAFDTNLKLDTLEARKMIRAIQEYSVAEQKKRAEELAEQQRKDSLADAQAQAAVEAAEAQSAAEEAKKKQDEAKQKQEELKKQKEQQKTNTATGGFTVTGNDEKTEKVSDQEYAAKMALQYVNGARTYENHKKAYEWAQKADAATKAKVIKKLEEMDFPIP